MNNKYCYSNLGPFHVKGLYVEKISGHSRYPEGTGNYLILQFKFLLLKVLISEGFIF